MPASIACWQASSGSSVGTSAARRHRRRAATARDRAHARRGRVDVETASHLERLHELAQAFLVSGFHDHVHRVLALHDGFALDLQSELPDVRAAQVIEKTGTHERVLRRTAVGGMLMSHDEERHGGLLEGSLSDQLSGPAVIPESRSQSCARLAAIDER